jgi:phage terminase small subunit
MDKRERAEQDYIAGMKYKEIAAKYDVSINTVKSWKNRHGWQREKKGAPPSKRVHTKNNKGAPKYVHDLVDNDKLTDKQKMFCLRYLQRFNATWAYMQVYGTDYETSKSNGSRLLTNANVISQIKELKSEMANDLAVTTVDIAREYARQAFADIGDYVNFGSWPETLKEAKPESRIIKDKDGNKRVAEVTKFKDVVDDNGNPVVYNHSYAYFANKEDVDTSLIKTIKMGKDGPVVELYDKQKAMSELNKYLDGDSELRHAQIRKANAEAELQELRVKAAKEGNTQVEDKLAELMDKIQEEVKGDGIDPNLHEETNGSAEDGS